MRGPVSGISAVLAAGFLRSATRHHVIRSCVEPCLRAVPKTRNRVWDWVTALLVCVRLEAYCNDLVCTKFRTYCTYLCAYFSGLAGHVPFTYHNDNRLT